MKVKLLLPPDAKALWLQKTTSTLKGAISGRFKTCPVNKSDNLESE
jgi:hypothetical protein